MTMRTIMFPLKVRQLEGGSRFVERVAARACQMQGMPEIHYGLQPAANRQSFERGAYAVICALESLGCELLVPPELSPTLPHDREDPR